MSFVDRSRRKAPWPAARWWRRLAPAVMLVALVGCESGYGFNGDPLTGGGTTIGRPLSPYSPSGSGGAAAQAASNVPPLPASHSQTSQAALAGGVNPTPENARDLRMGGSPIVPTSSSGGAARGVAPSGAVLAAPQEVPETTSKLTPVASTDASFQRTAAPGPGPAAPLASFAGSITYEQAQQMLQQRGVKHQRLETVGDKGEWKFRCSVPNPSNPSVYRVYEVKAATDLAAMRAVIDKIDQDRR